MQKIFQTKKSISLCNFADAQDKIAYGNATVIGNSTNQVVMVRHNATYYFYQCMSTSTHIIIIRRELVPLETHRGDGKFDNV